MHGLLYRVQLDDTYSTIPLLLLSNVLQLFRARRPLLKSQTEQKQQWWWNQELLPSVSYVFQYIFDRKTTAAKVEDDTWLVKAQCHSSSPGKFLFTFLPMGKTPIRAFFAQFRDKVQSLLNSSPIVKISWHYTTAE